MKQPFLLPLTCLFASLPCLASAGERRFAFSYETNTAAPGVVEYEQWVTWKAHQGDNHDFSRFEFRHELEFGITDRLQLGLYLADWRLTTGTSEDGAEYRTSGIEAIYQLTDPQKSLFGSALYGEVLLGPEKFALEGKLLLQKNFGPFVAVYNTIVEAEWEGSGYKEKVGVWENTFGLSYQVTPQFLVGLEATHEIEFEDWSEAGDHVVYVGPNVSYRKGNFYATIAPLFQVSGVSGEPDFTTRLIFGFNF
jgi:hypothetical protein